MRLLEIAVEAGPSGPVVKLSGECDLTTVGQLRQALGAQIADGARYLTIDLSALRFADSASFRALLEVHRTLQDAGGAVELLDPQPAVAQAIGLLGIDQLLAVRAKGGSGDHPVIP